MNPLNNPFSPGAGSSPPELAGRSEMLRSIEILLARIKAGRSEQSMFMVGLRGVGKQCCSTGCAKWPMHRATSRY